MTVSITDALDGQLLFSFDAIKKEVEGMARVSSTHLGPGADRAIRQWLDQLEQIRHSSINQPYDWVLPPRYPITTKDSEGKYYPTGRGTLTVYARITAIWTIQGIL